MTPRRGILLIVLACLGALTIPAARASASTATLATLQAEQMQLPAGAAVVTDRSASGGQAVTLGTPGTALTGSVVLSSSATSLRIVAHGIRCQSGWPTLTATMDGKRVLNAVSVSSTGWQTYSSTLALAAGTHTVTISDTASTACRVLSVDVLTLTGPAPVPPTVSLTASPASVSAGGVGTLTWKSTGASSCTASGGWSGPEPVAGSVSTAALATTTSYGLTCTGAGGSASASTTVTVVQPPCQSIIAPAYFYPSAGGLWSTALAAAPGVGAMVANVNSGPGATVNPDYASAIAQAQAAGIAIYGYVDTDYGAIPLATVEANIALWHRFYGVTGIFLDEASTSSSELAYYRSLTAYVHSQAAGAQTILNFGTIPSQSAMTEGDILITYEGDYTNFVSTRFPSWMESYAASRFYDIVYGVPDQTAMTNVLEHAASAGAGLVYATNDVLPNPYDTLPSYLSAESSAVRSGC